MDRSMDCLAPAVIVGCTVFNAFLFIPSHTEIFGETYADVETVLPKVLADHDVSGSILFMDSIDRLADHTDPFNDFYATGFMRNALDFDGDIVFARNLKERNHELANRHPDRTCYLYRYHRGLDKGLLYRMYFEGDSYEVKPVASDAPYLVQPPRGEAGGDTTPK